MLNLQNLLIGFFALDLFFVTALVTYMVYSFYKKINQIKNTETRAHEKAQEIILRAQNQAEQILSKVENKAQELLNHSELFKGDLEKAFETSLKSSGQKYVELLEKYSSQFVTDYENLLKLVKDQALKKATESMTIIEQEIGKQLDASKQSINDAISTSVVKAKQEIENYKREEIEKVDKEIDSLVVDLAKDLLRINLEAKDHKKLVINALDKAKEQGMFFM